jgi:hypothetical protein
MIGEKNYTGLRLKIVRQWLKKDIMIRNFLLNGVDYLTHPMKIIIKHGMKSFS